MMLRVLHIYTVYEKMPIVPCSQTRDIPRYTREYRALVVVRGYVKTTNNNSLPWYMSKAGYNYLHRGINKFQ